MFDGFVGANCGHVSWSLGALHTKSAEKNDYIPSSSIHSVLLDVTKPANFTIKSTHFYPLISIHRQTTCKNFLSSGSLPCSNPASISLTPCKTAVIPARSQVAWRRSTTLRPVIGPTDHANGRRAPSRCPPPCLEPYAADIHLDMVASLEYTLLIQASVCLPSTSSAFPFLSSLAPPDARRSA
jgi:hypothetical protein